MEVEGHGSAVPSHDSAEPDPVDYSNNPSQSFKSKVEARSVQGPTIGQATGSITNIYNFRDHEGRPNGRHARNPVFPPARFHQPTGKFKFRAPPPRQQLEMKYRESLRFPEMNARRANIASKRARGTCQWVLRHSKFQAWSSTEKSILWVRGHPGSGKSTLMEFLLSQHEAKAAVSEEQPTILSFFLNARGVHLEHSFDGLLRSLLYQIFSADMSLLTEPSQVVRSALSEVKAREDQDGRTRYFFTGVHSQNILKAVFESVVQDLAKRSRVVLLVDALDEAGAEVAVDIIKFFQQLAIPDGGPDDQLTKLKICFSSRWYPNVTLDSRLVIAVEECNSGDISTYLSQEFSNSHIPKQSAVEFTKVIQEKANGIFIWVFLVVREVWRMCLKGVPNTQILQAIEELPRDLETLFRTILNIGGPEDAALRVKLFQWMSFSHMPLTLDHLRFALVLDANSQHKTLIEFLCDDLLIDDDASLRRRVSELSCGLIEFRDFRVDDSFIQKHNAQYIHQTAKDFILEIGLPTLDGSNNNISGAAHFQISRSCVKYLLLSQSVKDVNLGGRIPRLLKRSPTLFRPKEEGLDAPEQEPLLEHFDMHTYAIQNWLRHARTAKSFGYDAVDLVPILLSEDESRVFNNLTLYPKSPRQIRPTLGHLLAAIGCPDALDYARRAHHYDFDKGDGRGNGVLLYACLAGRRAKETMSYLVTHGVSPSRTDDRGLNAVEAMTLEVTHSSKEKRHWHTGVINLIEAALDADIQLDTTRALSYYFADLPPNCDSADVALIEMLLKAGADPNQPVHPFAERSGPTQLRHLGFPLDYAGLLAKHTHDGESSVKNPELTALTDVLEGYGALCMEAAAEAGTRNALESKTNGQSLVPADGKVSYPSDSKNTLTVAPEATDAATKGKSRVKTKPLKTKFAFLACFKG